MPWLREADDRVQRRAQLVLILAMKSVLGAIRQLGFLLLGNECSWARLRSIALARGAARMRWPSPCPLNEVVLGAVLQRFDRRRLIVEAAQDDDPAPAENARACVATVSSP